MELICQNKFSSLRMNLEELQGKPLELRKHLTFLMLVEVLLVQVRDCIIIIMGIIVFNVQ